MKLVPFTRTLKRLRLGLGLTQEQLAARTAMKHSRIVDLELGRRYPSREELRILALALHTAVNVLADDLVSPDHTSRAGEIHRLFCPRVPPLKISRTRPTWIRLLHASRYHRDVYKPLVDGVRERPDYPSIALFLRQAVADSRYEVLVWLQCLNRQFFPEWISPTRCNYRSWPVFEDTAHGDLRWPCLVCTEPFPVVMFPQLPVLTRVEPWRMDLLIGVKLGTRKFWVNGEVDGEMHDASQDGRRAQQIQLPRIKLEPQDVLAPDCVDRLLGRLQAL